MITIIFISIGSLALTGCISNDISGGIAQVFETPEKKAKRLKKEAIAGQKRREYKRQKELAKQKELVEKAELLLAAFNKTCSDYGYQPGTPDFNQCVGNEIKSWDRDQALLAMEEAAQLRDAEQVKREKNAERRRVNEQRKRDRDAEYEQSKKDINEFFDMPNY